MGKGSRMSSARAQGIHTQSVDEQDHCMIDGTQAQPIGFRPYRGDRTFQHVGKAHRVGFGRR